MDNRTSPKGRTASKIKSSIRERLLKVSKYLGIPVNLVTPLVSQFAKHVEKSGEEWTVARYKAIRTSYIQMYAGKNVFDIRVPWIKTGSHTMYGGHLGALEVWAGNSPKRQAKFLQLLRMYTALQSNTVTKAQADKFLNSVKAQPVEVVTFKDITLLGISRLVGVLSSIGYKVQPFGIPDPLLSYTPAVGKRAPTLEGKSVGDDEDLLRGLSLFTNSFEMRMYKNKYPEIWKAITFGLGEDFSYSVGDIDGWKTIPFTGGKISYIQEPGYKLRAVANPHRVLQHILAPLGNELYKVLCALPFDFTHQQDFAIPIIQSWLSSGVNVHSIDLSDATNNFPLGPQLMIQNHFFGANYATDLFYTCSRADWFLPTGGLTSWTKGQPLGLYPSFASFALSHSVIVLGVMTQDEYITSVNSEQWPFTVLGDDIAIRGDELAYRYRNALSRMGVPVADSKTISSTRLAEFAGKVIFSDSYVNSVKFKEMSDDNFLDLTRFFGPSFIKALRPRQQLVANKLLEVPEMFGGLGFNPSGKPLEQRIAENLWVLHDAVDQPFLMDLFSVLNNRLYSEESVIPIPEELSILASTFDQKVSSLVRSNLGPSLVPMAKILGTNLSSISEDPSLLPYVTRAPSKRSTLDGQ
jgi:hypothetical protein